jgi:hypothetical protein
MLLVTERAGAGPAARNASLWDRIVARARSFTLDRELARGASPEASVRLALRAQRLTGMRERRMLAEGIRHLLDSTAGPDGTGRPAGSARPLVTVRRDQVRAAAPELEALADRLLRPAPVPARGMAQTSLLLHDGSGPVYRRGSAEDLPARVHQTVEALDALACW